MALKSQRTNKAAPEKTRRMDKDPRIRDEAAIIALELKRESMDISGSLTDLLVGMG